MGADSPDDSLLFAGRLSGAGPGTPVGGGPRLSAAGVQPGGRGGVDRAPGSSLPAVRGWGQLGRRRGPALVRRLKSDAFTAIVPVTTLAGTHHPEQVQAWFAVGRRRGHHRALLPGGAAGPARRDAGAHRAGRVGPPLDPAAGHHGDRAGDPAAAGVEPGVRGLLRRPGPLQGVQRPVQLLRRRPGHLHSVPYPARRGQGADGPPGLRGAHRRRRLHLHHSRRPTSARFAARYSRYSMR